MDPETAAKNVLNENVWRRLVYIVLFAVAMNVVWMILWALVLVQFLSRLFSGKSIERAAEFGQNLATYAYEVVRFLTFRTDETPWPFAAWPHAAPQNRPSPAPAPEEGGGTAGA